MTDALPLARFKVLDLTRLRSGPTAVRQFADWGAQVLMVETKGGATDVGTGRRSSDFQNLNRNKRSIELDLKTPEGLEIFYRLADEADVVFENFRPDVKRRLKIDYETLAARNTRLVYVSVSGFGQDGPYADRPGLDQIVQGMGGLMSITGLPGQGPVRAGIAVADSAAGLYGALGAMTALLEREVTGKGRWVRTSLLQAQIAMLDFQAARWLVEGEVPGQAGNDHPTASPMGLFETSDGVINLAVTGQEMFERFCRALGAPQLIDDPRFDRRGRSRNRAPLNAEITEITRRKPVTYWIEVLNGAGVPCGPVNRMDEVFADPQVQHLGIVRAVTHPSLGELKLVGQPMEISGLDGGPQSAAPDAGQHSQAVLEELGYGQPQIEALRRKGVI